jgi:hypothetical protein
MSNERGQQIPHGIAAQDHDEQARKPDRSNRRALKAYCYSRDMNEPNFDPAAVSWQAMLDTLATSLETYVATQRRRAEATDAADAAFEANGGSRVSGGALAHDEHEAELKAIVDELDAIEIYRSNLEAWRAAIGRDA